MMLMVKAISLLKWDSNKKTKETTYILAIGTLAPGHNYNHVPAYHIDKTIHAHTHAHTSVYIHDTNYILAHELIDKIGRVLAMTR